MADTDNITSKASAAAGCDPAQGAALAEAFAAALRERLSMLESVAIPGFGSFTPVKHEERVGKWTPHTVAATYSREFHPRQQTSQTIAEQ